MRNIRVLPEVPLNKKRLEEDLGRDIFLEMILRNKTIVIEGMLESFEPNLIVSLDNCVVIDDDGEYKCAGITRAPFIWKQVGIKTIAEQANRDPQKLDFRGILYRNNMIDGSLNNTTSCRVYQMIKLFLNEEITIDEFLDFKKKMEKEERIITALKDVKIKNKAEKKESG